jgi:hypothetical protein
MVDSIRAALDELMGEDRNGEPPVKDVVRFYDSSVCKPFLQFEYWF